MKSIGGIMMEEERPTNLNEWAKAIHENAKAHGWWDEERNLPEILMLCGSELSEALTEMVDCIIRILDYFGKMGVDVDTVMRIKHEYNKTRPYRHGGKKC